MAFGVFMMRKTIPSKHKIIHFSSEELFFSLNYSKNILLEQFKTAESHYDFLKNKSKDLFEIKLENHCIPNTLIKIDEVLNESNNNYKLASINFSQHYNQDLFKGRISIVQKKPNIIDLIIQLSVKWDDNIPKKILLKFPFLVNLTKHKQFLKPGYVFDQNQSIKKGSWNFHEYPPATIADTTSKVAVGIEFFDQFPW